MLVRFEVDAEEEKFHAQLQPLLSPEQSRGQAPDASAAATLQLPSTTVAAAAPATKAPQDGQHTGSEQPTEAELEHKYDSPVPRFSAPLAHSTEESDETGAAQQQPALPTISAPATGGSGAALSSAPAAAASHSGPLPVTAPAAKSRRHTEKDQPPHSVSGSAADQEDGSLAAADSDSSHGESTGESTSGTAGGGREPRAGSGRAVQLTAIVPRFVAATYVDPTAALVPTVTTPGAAPEAAPIPTRAAGGTKPVAQQQRQRPQPAKSAAAESPIASPASRSPLPQPLPAKARGHKTQQQQQQQQQQQPYKELFSHSDEEEEEQEEDIFPMPRQCSHCNISRARLHDVGLHGAAGRVPYAALLIRHCVCCFVCCCVPAVG